ncbi:sulfotransferase family protein [Devosia sp. A16]|uniref:sulfotransferase family protein n=1 Tax=Devosia sp. A16 TaxID=1736675 RepID=UPI0006D7DCBA|nr:sulfotransferase [Devosia sp. A16]
MAALSVRDEILLAPIAGLRDFGSDAEKYYRTLAASDDPVLAVGGILGLIERDVLRHTDLPRLRELGRQGAVRRRAFNYFARLGDHILAEEVAALGPDTVEDLEKVSIAARSRNDVSKQRDVEIAKYLAWGEVGMLRSAATLAEFVEGWRGAIPILARATAVRPGEVKSFSALATLLEAAGRYDLLEYLLSQVAGVVELASNAELFRAATHLAKGETETCLFLLKRLEDAGRAQDRAFSIGSTGEQLRAKAYHKLGQFREAHKSYSTMNALDAAAFGSTNFIADCLVRNSQAVPHLTAPNRPNYVMMLGFPRSGTTMLENALAAHPRVETFEEAPTMHAATSYIDRGNKGQTKFEPGSVALYLEGRERYFSSVDRLRQKQGADVYVDKLPIRSLFAPFLKHLIPDQRFIFSVRHPYDVALSCFQQRFGPNPAMANFLNLRDTIRLYDLTMTEWFKVHSLDDRLVHYVRYDDLVTDFETVTRGTLAFLGLDWDPAVLEFAERAGERANRTPSYQKVRQGLSLGVQTYWRNYDFLFTQAEAAPLTKWAKFFGYETF